MAGYVLDPVCGAAQVFEKGLSNDGGLFPGRINGVPLAFDREVADVQRGELAHRGIQRQGMARQNRDAETTDDGL